MCTFPGCDRAPRRPNGSQQFCNTHECQMRRTGTMWPIGSERSLIRAKREGVCAHDGCKSKQVARGYCEGHYSQWKRMGRTVDIEPGRRYRNRTFVQCRARDCTFEDRQSKSGYCNRHARNNERLIRVYGISMDERDALYDQQGGACAICGTVAALHIDHCHDSGKVRGLLCGSCNRAIGLLAHDANVLRRAAEYVE